MSFPRPTAPPLHARTVRNPGAARIDRRSPLGRDHRRSPLAPRSAHPEARRLPLSPREQPGAETCIYAELAGRVLRLAGALLDRVAPGQRVVLLYPPGRGFIEAFLACLAAGIVAVPASPSRRNQNLGRVQGILADCSPTIVLTTRMPPSRPSSTASTTSTAPSTASAACEDGGAASPSFSKRSTAAPAAGCGSSTSPAAARGTSATSSPSRRTSRASRSP